MKQEIIERLDELKEKDKWRQLSLRPPEGDTVIRPEGNRMYINEGRDGYFEGVTEQFYDYCVEHYDSRYNSHFVNLN